MPSAEEIRQEKFLRSLPWVQEIKCDYIKWTAMPVSMLKRISSLTEDEILPYKCTMRARWYFSAVRSGRGIGDAASGTYCNRHLLQQFEFDAENLRLREFKRTKGEEKDCGV